MDMFEEKPNRDEEMGWERSRLSRLRRFLTLSQAVWGADPPVETQGCGKSGLWASTGFFAGCLIFFVPVTLPDIHFDMDFRGLAILFIGVIHAIIWSGIGAGLAFIRNDRIRRVCVALAAAVLLLLLFLTWRTDWGSHAIH